MKFEVTLTDGTVHLVEADYWVQDQPDGPTWAHYHGWDEVCTDACHIVSPARKREAPE